MNGWTPERRARQAQAIRRWRPWEHSTGPRTAEGRARSARNAYCAPPPSAGTIHRITGQGRAQLADQLALRTELHDDVSPAVALRVPAVWPLCVGHPDIAVTVDVQPVRLEHHAPAETGDQVAGRVELEDGGRARGRRTSYRRTARPPRCGCRPGPCRRRPWSPTGGRRAAWPSRRWSHMGSGRRSAG